MGEGRQGRRAEPTMLGLGREGKGSGLALLGAGRTGAWRAEEDGQKSPVGPASGAANTQRSLADAPTRRLGPLSHHSK